MSHCWDALGGGKVRADGDDSRWCCMCAVEEDGPQRVLCRLVGPFAAYKAHATTQHDELHLIMVISALSRL